MNNVKKISNDDVISELMELVAKVRRGDVVSVTIVTTGFDGVVTANKICGTNQLAARFVA